MAKRNFKPLLLAMGYKPKAVSILTDAEAERLYTKKQHMVHKPIKARKSTRRVNPIRSAMRDQRNEQKAMRKHGKARFDAVSQMRGDKYGWTYTTVHGDREYRVVGEPCHVCGRDHGRKGK